MDSKITRRAMIGAGTVSALTTGVLGAVGTVEAATPATVVYADTLAAESQSLYARYQDAALAHERLEDELAAQFPLALALKVRDLTDAIALTNDAHLDFCVAEIARHLPGLAPVVNGLLTHVLRMSYQQPGACCTPSNGYEA